MLKEQFEKFDNEFIEKCIDHTERTKLIQEFTFKRIACNRLFILSSIILIIVNIFWRHESTSVLIFSWIALFFAVNGIITIKLLILKIVDRLSGQNNEKI